ncbi:polyamine aminopropyltransferase [bacterium M00.F.Ca.ET.228.01.1.1]|uniref:polyamine aminopropyltransferase n=1 Tax=Paraburkholderia phenoliruptrix TaxID=252970 RepID=UPI0010921BDF|nr:polyamine aminopropyltransferase [Paraburkholderia phenoliruptrix]TGP44193.1 polyamine aminopropyltransferase [bacterium M00.F.Ca.ET.228.01.1.1]TGS01856.1 polyamine aminopropyltransferase [bacterium M00.F.Ca.ET.191.01.1.1]TGU08539.1 polyamine aminopropyltransferase [bacterium M00.F.Ca.ET.155.01.1.1]MBW0450085.1 polyamine aminopropyltransferase [Paraburkholderia phenoliruptrix]MBW9101605.1 polyamine aminopropyltransferase [Paraburkholderia phenoliruptrix]
MQARPLSAPLLFHPSPDVVYGFPHASLVARVDSPYQRIEVWDTPQLGRLFTLDGRPMTSTGDEFIYHECMVHPAALAHPAPKAALVLGGGDGGAARQLLAHAGMERIVVAELDEQVVRLTREHMPEVHGGALDDARVELVIGDAAHYVAAAADARSVQFDLIVFDLTPPDSPAAGLYTSAFYRQLKRVMSPGAALSVHLGSPYFHAARIARLLDDLRGEFAVVRTMHTYVPLYGSLWMMATASDRLDPAALAADSVTERLAARQIDALKHYSPATHAGLFAVPASVRDKLSQFLKPTS